MRQRDVAVVILSHRPEFVAEAMQSAFAQTAHAPQVVVNFDREYFPEKLNDAVRATRSDYVIVLPDDDRLDPTYCAKTIAAIRSGPYDLAYTDTQLFGQRLPFPIALGMPTFDREVLRMYCVPWVTALFTRDLFDRLGGFDCTLEYFDWDFWMRAADAGARAVHVREPLYQFRDHAGAGSRVMNHEPALHALRTKHAALHTPESIERLTLARAG